METNAGKTDILARTSNLQRKTYLRRKGIDAADDALQLSLLFPGEMPDTCRSIPNDYARAALFTTRAKNQPRRTLEHERLFHLHDGVSVLFTGIELRAEDDELVWLQIMHIAKTVPLGSPFEFSILDLVQEIGWHRNGTYYDKTRKCISRLKASEVLVQNDKAYGKSDAISLISRYESLNDTEGKPTHYRAWIDPAMIVLFAGSTFTNHQWELYRRLSPIARRLADYASSHKSPYPLSCDRFQLMCGSDNKAKASWRQNVRKACAELVAVKIVATAEIDGGLIHIVR